MGEVDLTSLSELLQEDRDQSIKQLVFANEVIRSLYPLFRSLPAPALARFQEFHSQYLRFVQELDRVEAAPQREQQHSETRSRM